MATPCHVETAEIQDNFKDIYKNFKRRDRPLNIQSVINFANLTSDCLSEVEDFPLVVPEGTPEFPGLKPVSQWKAYQIKNKPGFVVIRNPFEAGYQRYWVQRCLVDFPVKPNTTNVDAHMERPSHIWESCLSEDGPDLTKDSLLMKLRWATLGYQYEWNTKEYFSDRHKVFPNDLAYLCSYIAKAMGYRDFLSEAGIVNYYRMDSTLMGHTDVSELDKAAPLISFSFGQDCIFLIGGPTKATAPVPLFLHSGDISLMTGPARLSFHAVPRILQADPGYIDACFCSDSNRTGTEQNSLSVNGRGDHDSASQANSINDKLTENCDKNSDTPVTIKNISDRRTENWSEENSNFVLSNKEAASDNEMEDEDPYSSSANQNSCNSRYQSCDSKADNSSDHHVSLTSQGGSCELSELKALMDRVISETDWSPFQKYLNQSRVNVNVRKVLTEGESLPISPAVIPKCPGKNH